MLDNPCAPVETRTPPLEVALRTMHNEVTELRNMVDDLKSRLAPICEPPQDGPCSTPDDAGETACPLRQQLTQLTGEVKASRRVLDDLMNRLEV